MAHSLQGKSLVTPGQSESDADRADVPVCWNQAAHPVATVCVSATEYDGLVQAVWQYSNLKQSLLQIGVNEGTLAQLSNSNNVGGFIPHIAVDIPAQNPEVEHNTLRTIHIMGISKRTPLADYLAVIRGGPVLESYIRPQGYYCAVVSFVHAADAVTFFKHVQTNGLYINRMRARVCWAQRQFGLRNFIAERINGGATRNLVIRQVDPAVTEQSIKKDLDHIHHMVVTKVSFAAGNCYICTNSVNNAMYGRTCMMSRQKFKGSKIDFFPDECAEPLETPSLRVKFKPAKQARKPTTKRAVNRFQALDVEGEEDAEDGEK